MEKITFEQLALSEEILQAVTDMGFLNPSPIQELAIPPILAGQDIIGQAQTGTGKTAAFAIPALEKLDMELKKVQILVLCPTRELAVQVAEEIKKISKYLQGVYTLAIYGGDSIDRQIKMLRKGVHIVVGTPGRIIDHIQRGSLELDDVKMIVLDEADEMLNMGFIDSIEEILQEVPEERQTVLFSATMPKPILNLTKRYQRNPELIKVLRQELTGDLIEQSYFAIKQQDKLELMLRLIEVHDLKLIVVFCNTKQKVDELVDSLQQEELMAEGLHGDLRQMQRNVVMNKFRKGTVNILVATDVAARGIDVDNVEAVFNYDVPLDPEYYVHRIGRTARAGKKGKSFTFVERRDMGRLKDIERYIKLTISQGEIPSKKDVVAYRQIKFAAKIKEEIEKLQGNNQFDAIIEQLEAEGNDLKDISKALISLQLNKEKSKSNESKGEIGTDDYNRNDRERGGRERDRDRGGNNRRGNDRERGGNSYGGNSYGGNKRGQNDRMTRLFLNVGRNQKISKSDVLGAITGETGINGNEIGAIDIYENFTFVDVSSESSSKVINTMNSSSIKGKKVNFEVAKN